MSTGHKKLGKYDVLDVIGRGGMGVIYKGIDPGIGRIVAIKMMTGGFAENPELLQRFYREAQSAGKLQHPNIVTIYDLGVQDGNPYLVMEFLEGESLEAAIKNRRPLLLEDKLNIVIQICDGLGYAHQRHIIHRDVKPANVMLLKDGGVKIVDFGIARVGGENMTRPGQIMGSIQYMSPEQINAGSVDARSDIFSLGVLLYQLLTATLPFEGKDTGETLLKIIHQEPRPLVEFLPDCPAELDDIVHRVLAKDREQRYQATEDLAFDLTHVQEQLKRYRVMEYLEAAQAARAQGQLSRAKEQLLQVLKIDRQNGRAASLLREVQQDIQRQQRGEQARELQREAEKALAGGDLGAAQAYLEQAVALDEGNAEIAQLYASVRESKARADTLRKLLEQAEMAQDAGDLDEARRAVNEALQMDANSTEVRSLHAAICREIAERDKQLQVQKFLGEARKQISSRQFTAALHVLKEAESIDPAVPGIQELINLAETGQQQEKR
ncbi:MAG TPA: protein kinase, partial [Terriglobales bacterium]|nr:protein kinase [Terriglobales bacterium]